MLVTYSYVAMTNCFVCRKKIDPDNCVQGGHVRLDDGTKITVCRHLKCEMPQGVESNRFGCYGRWVPWMGLMVMTDRA